jgi:hypothetical protein
VRGKEAEREREKDRESDGARDGEKVKEAERERVFVCKGLPEWDASRCSLTSMEQ